MAVLKRQETRDLLGYWTRIRGDQPFPAWGDIDFGKLKPYLPNVFVIDLVSDDAFVLSLVGETLTARIGSDITGINLLEAVDSSRVVNMRSRAELMFRLRCAVCNHIQVPTAGAADKMAEALFLPVDNGPDRIRQVFGTIYYIDGPDETADHRGIVGGYVLAEETFLEVGGGYAIALDGCDISGADAGSAG